MVNSPKPGYYSSHPDKSFEYTLLQTAKDTDISKANSAKTRLLADNEGFLKSVITKWIQPGSYINFEDLLQESKLSFLAAIENYDFQYDVSIRSYARYYLLDLQKRYFRKSRFIEFEDSHLPGSYTIKDPEFKTFDLKSMLNKAIQCLTAVEQQVIRLHFFKGLRKRQIAKQRCCSEARISQIVKKALPKMKTWLQERGIEPNVLELN